MAHPLDQIRQAIAETYKSKAFRQALNRAGYELVDKRTSWGKAYDRLAAAEELPELTKGGHRNSGTLHR